MRPRLPFLLVSLVLTALLAGPAPAADEIDEAGAARTVAGLLEADPGSDPLGLWNLSDRLASGGKVGIGALRAAADGASPARKLAIARALVLLEDYTFGMDLLQKVVDDEATPVALKAAGLRILGEDGELEQAEWVEERIDRVHDPRVKMAMAKALWTMSFSNRGKGKEVLLLYLRSTDPDLRAEGALALGEIGAASEAKPVLAEMKDEPTERGRSAAFLLDVLNLEQERDQALRGTGSGSPDGDAPVTPLPGRTPTAWPLLDEILQTLEKLYLDKEDVDRRKLEDAMAAGITEALDPFTTYFTPEQNAKFQEGLDPTYGGVGAYVHNDANNQDRFTISRPIWGGPMYRAGLVTGDVMLEIDGTSTDGLSVDQCVRLLKGPPGTDVTITVFRPGWTEPRHFTLKRARITIPTTAYDILPGRIGFLEILSFSTDTAAEVTKVLQYFHEQRIEALVIDVRFNGGGYLQSAVDIASELLPPGKLVVSEKGRPGTGAENRHVSRGTGASRRQVPVVVLMNQATASAAEILAGSLRVHDRARLVGSMSFGKGSVQRPWDLKSRPGETFTDAPRDVPVAYTDSNGNGRHDKGEPVRTRLRPNFRYDPPEKFVDANGNARWDEGEEFTDDNLNGRWDAGEEFTDANGNGIWDPGGLLKLTIRGYYLPDGRRLKRKTEVVDGKVVISGGLEPDVEAEQNPLDYWEIQAQRTLDADPAFKAYVDGLFDDHRALAERLARSDGKDPSRYPGFDAFYDTLDTPLDREAVRFLVRLNLRRRIGDELGRKLVGDIVDDPVLQAALIDLFRTTGRDLATVEDLAFLAREAEEDPEDEDAKEKPVR